MKKIYIVLSLIIISILGSFFLFKTDEEKIIIETDEQTIKIEEEIPKEIKIKKAEIKGMVKNPGVYEFIENDRVIDLIEKAGGLLKESNTSTINLSKTLTDEMLVIIYSNKEIEAAKEKNIKIQYETVEIPCKCPDSINDACINKETNSNETTKTININKATKEELMTLPNIGESKAENIINYRESFKFETIEQIKEVSGIGESLFEKIKDYITV